MTTSDNNNNPAVLGAQDPTRPATMHDVAREAGVALSSVSRTLSGHPDVSPAMRRRVLAAAEALGYQPDLLAQSLRRGTTMSVGFVVRDISNPLFAEIAQGAEETLRNAGYSMLLSNSGEDPEVEAQNIELFRRRRVDGLILSLVSETDPRTIAALQATKAPLVLLDRESAAVPASAVNTDHYHGMHAAVSDLLRQGHERVALVSGPKDLRPTRERVRGLVDAHRAAGLTVDDRLLVLGSFAESFARESTEHLLSLDRAPTAIIAGGLQSSAGVLAALSEREILVGENIAFVACDEVPLLNLFRPPLSVVKRDTKHVGRQAAQLFIDMVAGQPPRVETVSTLYIARASSSPPAGS